MRKADVARYIIGALPKNPGPEGAMPADQLALVLLLESASWVKTIGNIAEALSLSQSSTSELVDRAEEKGRVHSMEVGRTRIVAPAARSVREAETSRAGRRPRAYRAGPMRRVTASASVGGADRLECGHDFPVTHDDNIGAKRRHCTKCRTDPPS